MGISDDIKPKKVSRFVEHPIYVPKKNDDTEEKTKTKNPKPEEKEKIDQSESELENFYNYQDSDKKERLEDDFFDNQREEKSAKFPNSEKKHRPFKRVIVAIVVLALVALIIYQNLDVIKSYFVKQKPSASESSAKNNYYTGEESQNSADSSTSNSSGTDNSTTQNQTQQTATPAAAATVEVLNGNGISGSAEKIKAALVAAGINVTNVGNAKLFTYTQTYVYYAAGFSDQASNVKNILSGKTITVEQSDDIASKYNIVVVVGKN